MLLTMSVILSCASANPDLMPLMICKARYQYGTVSDIEMATGDGVKRDKQIPEGSYLLTIDDLNRILQTLPDGRCLHTDSKRSLVKTEVASSESASHSAVHIEVEPHTASVASSSRMVIDARLLKPSHSVDVLAGGRVRSFAELTVGLDQPWKYSRLMRRQIDAIALGRIEFKLNGNLNKDYVYNLDVQFGRSNITAFWDTRVGQHWNISGTYHRDGRKFQIGFDIPEDRPRGFDPSHVSRLDGFSSIDGWHIDVEEIIKLDADLQFSLSAHASILETSPTDSANFFGPGFNIPRGRQGRKNLQALPGTQVRDEVVTQALQTSFRLDSECMTRSDDITIESKVTCVGLTIRIDDLLCVTDASSQ